MGELKTEGVWERDARAYSIAGCWKLQLGEIVCLISKELAL